MRAIFFLLQTTCSACANNNTECIIPETGTACMGCQEDRRFCPWSVNWAEVTAKVERKLSKKALRKGFEQFLNLDLATGKRKEKERRIVPKGPITSSTPAPEGSPPKPKANAQPKEKSKEFNTATRGSTTPKPKGRTPKPPVIAADEFEEEERGAGADGEEHTEPEGKF